MNFQQHSAPIDIAVLQSAQLGLAHSRLVKQFKEQPVAAGREICLVAKRHLINIALGYELDQRLGQFQGLDACHGRFLHQVFAKAILVEGAQGGDFAVDASVDQTFFFHANNVGFNHRFLHLGKVFKFILSLQVTGKLRHVVLIGFNRQCRKAFFRLEV